MGETPLITPEECLREAYHAEQYDVAAAGKWRRAARAIDFWRTAASELAHQEDK